MNAQPITQRVKRWDIYDIADELADIPGMLSTSLGAGRYASVDAVIELIKGLERRLWKAAERGGEVGPWPEYRKV